MVELGVWNAQVAGSNPASQTLGTYLQLVEHLFEEQGVIGSNPIVPASGIYLNG